MHAEHAEVCQHLGQHPPFDRLSTELLELAGSQVEIAYYRAGSDILVFDQEIRHLCYVRSGAVEVFRRSGDLYNRLGEGEIFGHFNLLRSNRVHFPAVALEDSLIYFIPETVFQKLCNEDEHFADFVELERPRLASAAAEQKKANDMIITRVRKLVMRKPLVLEDSLSLREAAHQLNEHSAQAALVVREPGDKPRYNYIDDAGSTWQLSGLLSDQDFRRAMAGGMSADMPLSKLVDSDLVTVQSDDSIYEAMLSLLRHGIDHLTVIHNRRPWGIVSLPDIVRYETNSSLYLVNSIYNQVSTEGLARLTPEVEAAFIRLLDEGATSQMVGRALSTIGRSITTRLLELAEQELGPPPVAYCFMTNGSMARDEQSIVTDQDNALILSDEFDEKAHDEYFLTLARRVSDGLAACGYTYCKGNIMATNKQWRQPLSRWRAYFENWIGQPTPERLLHSSIFFDLDSIAGERGYVDELRELLSERAADNPRFLASLARNALNRTPPLGFFRTFVMEKDGRHGKSINLKRRGTAPMVDLIRVHALACRSRAQNSFERLDDIANTQLLGPDVPGKLSDALEYLALTRMRQHAASLKQGEAPENTINPERVERDTREHLRQAFQALSYAQKFLGYRYPMTQATQRSSR